MKEHDKDAPVTGREMIECLREAGDDNVREALERGNLRVSSSDKADALRPWINRILKANGIGIGAFVSDKSSMWDLMPFEPEERVLVISERLGIPVSPDDYIYEVAERLRDAEAAQDN
jgi:hypothetical protein